jgi:hypothetical protein
MRSDGIVIASRPIGRCERRPSLDGLWADMAIQSNRALHLWIAPLTLAMTMAARPSRPLKAATSLIVVVMVMIVVVIIMMVMMMVVVMMMIVMMVVVIFSHYHRLFFRHSSVIAALVLGAQHLLSIRNGIQQLGK